MKTREGFLSRLRRRVLYFLGLAVLFYLILALWAGGPKLLHTLRDFRPILIVYIFGAVLLNYGLRFLKWSYYLRVQKISLPTSESLVIFVSAFSMAVTPGKVGELLKAELVKERTGIPRRRTVPIVLAERITDLLGLLVLAGVGVLTLPLPARVQGVPTGLVLCIAAAVPFALLGVLMTAPLARALVHFLERFPVIGPHAHKLEDSYEAMRPLITPMRLFYMTALSVCSWGGECLAYFLVWTALPEVLGPWQAAFIYAFSTLAGVVTPGGLGPTDRFLVGLPMVMAQGVSKQAAVSAMGLIRAATLWFAVILGLGALMFFARRYKLDEGELEALQEAGE